MGSPMPRPRLAQLCSCTSSSGAESIRANSVGRYCYANTSNATLSLPLLSVGWDVCHYRELGPSETAATWMGAATTRKASATGTKAQLPEYSSIVTVYSCGEGTMCMVACLDTKLEARSSMCCVNLRQLKTLLFFGIRSHHYW